MSITEALCEERVFERNPICTLCSTSKMSQMECVELFKEFQIARAIAQDLSYRLQVSEFASLTTSEFLCPGRNADTLDTSQLTWCQRDFCGWIQSYPCNGEAVPRADKFGDLITADHKVLSANCESRNNHRYAVVVQDLATQWIQAYPCKNKTSQETQRSLQKFLEPDKKPKVIYTDNWNSAKLVKIFPGIIARLHHTDRRLMGLLREQYAE